VQFVIKKIDDNLPFARGNLNQVTIISLSFSWSFFISGLSSSKKMVKTF